MREEQEFPIDVGCIYVCGGCGRKERAGWWKQNINRGFVKPADWYERADESGIQIACSRRCIDTIAARTGKPASVFPF